MAAFTGTPVKAPTYTLQTNGNKASSMHVEGVRKFATSGVYTHAAAAGAGTGAVDLIKLPHGKVRLFTDASRVFTTQWAANADLHIGYRAYVGSDGVTVVEDDNAFGDNLDAGGGALDAALDIPAKGYHDFDSKDGVVLFALIDTGNIETDDTLELYVEYATLTL
jgi:hypothetical protein